MTNQRRITTDTLPTLLDNIAQYGVGFEPLFEKLSHQTLGQSYPPYNLVKIDEDNYVIELAVAGFTRDSLDIEQHKNVLKVQGKKLDDESSEGNGYIHKGISSRSFTKNWTLAEHIEVVSVTLDHGILSIVLRRNVPEQDQPKTFTIK